MFSMDLFKISADFIYSLDSCTATRGCWTDNCCYPHVGLMVRQRTCTYTFSLSTYTVLPVSCSLSWMLASGLLNSMVLFDSSTTHSKPARRLQHTVLVNWNRLWCSSNGNSKCYWLGLVDDGLLNSTVLFDSSTTHSKPARRLQHTVFVNWNRLWCSSNGNSKCYWLLLVLCTCAVLDCSLRLAS